jgi:hypothetical protein
MVQQRLEHGKIAEVLVAEAVFKLADLLGNVGLAFEALDHLPADFPIELFDFRLLREIEHA